MNTIELAELYGFVKDVDSGTWVCTATQIERFGERKYSTGHAHGYNEGVEANKAQVEFYKTALECVIGLERSRTTKDKFLAGHSSQVIDLLKAFGLEGQNVSSLSFKLVADDVAELSVTRWIKEKEMQEFLEVLSKYKISLEEKDTERSLPLPY
jgi:hypothetical protein